MYQQLKSMIPDACCTLGMKGVKDIDHFTTMSMLYLSMDREHYIEFDNTHVPESVPGPPYAVICRLLPIARKVSVQKENDATLTETFILYIVAAKEGTWYVTSQETSSISDDPEECYWTDPVYRCIPLEKIDSSMEIMEPSKLIPPALPLGRDIYAMLFKAVARCTQHLHIRHVPLITERLMRVLDRFEERSLVLDGKETTGKLIPIGVQEMEGPIVREDHEFFCSTRFCLFIGKSQHRYVTNTEFIFRYFSEDDPEKKIEVCRTVHLHELRGSFNSFYR